MCGIVGSIGERESLEILLAGLKKLEYRGYDSAGVSLCEFSGIVTVRSPGKIAALEEKLKNFSLHGTLGIAHTRWATHGAPTERNAHPHTSFDGRIAVVHNGIIENHAILKSSLQQKGIEFLSETDTEVIAHLIGHLYKGDLQSAVLQALNMLEGALGIAVICKDEPDVLIGARRGSPLIVGITPKTH
jgi:glucosamine--fructose-6-phosphate aminotransferase (isomerizing)